MCRGTLGAVITVFWASLSIAQSKFLRCSLVPRLYWTLIMALPEGTESSPGSVFDTSIGNRYKVLRTVGSFLLSLSSLAHGNFLGSAKAGFSKWKFLDKWMYQSWSCMTNISNHMKGNLINKHVMNNFY